MNILHRLRLRTKLALLMALSTLALVTSIVVSANVMRARMFDDRVDKLRAVVETTIGIAQSLENQVTAHQLTHEQALEQFRGAAHAIRFDAGEGYVYAQTLDNLFVVHGADPKLENTASLAKDEAGRSLTSLISDVLRNADQGSVSYTFVRPGQTLPQPKVAYVARFAPWNLVFAAGAYVADLDAAFRATLLQLTSVGGALMLVTLVAGWLVNRDIAGPLGGLKAAMARLSRGELDVAIPGTDRRDEVGAMADAVVVFKDGMKQAERLAGEQQAERARAEAAKRDALTAMAERIEGEAGMRWRRSANEPPPWRTTRTA